MGYTDLLTPKDIVVMNIPYRANLPKLQKIYYSYP